jgi:DNA replication and repair protein RecF
MVDGGHASVAAQNDMASGSTAVGGMAGQGAPVSIGRLDLAWFRSYRSGRIECDARPVVLLGANGSGKTNVLEALSFLAPGRGLRRARLSEIDYRAQLMGREDDAATSAWAVAARLNGPQGEVAIGTGRDGDSVSGDRRLVRIDGQAVKGQAALAGYLSLSWLTPQMDRLFQEGAAPRRRFFDRLVFGFHADHATHLSAYEQAMRERARLLRDGGDPLWLARLEETMAREGVAVAASRVEIADWLDRAAAEAAVGAPASPFPAPRIAMRGLVEGWLGAMPALAAEERLRAELAAGRRVDAEIGGAVAGPHRSDLSVSHAAKNVAAEQCSTGEQKALLIAIVLAHARLRAQLTGSAPILLLDEVAAHLDGERRRALFQSILDLGVQAWLTGADAPFFAELEARAQFFTVADGGIQPASGP